jgi:Protein of unknown function (DUF3040)
MKLQDRLATTSHIPLELCDDERVPLSDEEERVLAELEAQLASDHVANRIRGRSVERTPSMAFPVVAALSCLLVAVVGFSIHIAIGVTGFVGLVASLVPLVKTLLSSFVEDSDSARYY